MLIHFLVFLTLGAWVGCIVFQSAIVAPSIFGTQSPDNARTLLRRLFPRFFRLGLLLAAVAGAVLTAALLTGSQSLLNPMLLTLALLVANGIALALIPATNDAADRGEAGHPGFRRLHAASVLLTLFGLISAIAAIWLTAAALAGGTS